MRVAYASLSAHKKIIDKEGFRKYHSNTLATLSLIRVGKGSPITSRLIAMAIKVCVGPRRTNMALLSSFTTLTENEVRQYQ
jgi:hypothetical protein